MDKASNIVVTDDLNVSYGGVRALRNVSIAIPERRITAFIGPSGCGKSTMLRCLNRMNDLIAGFGMTGRVLYRGTDIYLPEVDAVQVRRNIGMVFQRPNVFPMKSIYENVAYGARINGYKGDIDELVERCLRRAALWDDVKERLRDSALELSGGQQQRLCIARALAVEPDVILLDEPCSSLDPISMQQIEELLLNLKETVTIVIVTHNLQQARRISDMTAFFNVERQEDGSRCGTLCEYGPTETVFGQCQNQSTRDYIEGRFG